MQTEDFDDLSDADFQSIMDGRRNLTRKLETLGFERWDMYPDGRERWMDRAGNMRVVKYDAASKSYIDQPVQ